MDNDKHSGSMVLASEGANAIMRGLDMTFKRLKGSSGSRAVIDVDGD